MQSRFNAAILFKVLLRHLRKVLAVLNPGVSTVAVILLGFSPHTKAGDEAVRYPYLPITTQWLRLEGNDTEEFKIFRKYTFVPEYKNSPVRNLLNLHCSRYAPSYITFVIPKQFSLREFYGADMVESQKFGLAVASEPDEVFQTFILKGDVIENSIFIDFMGDQRKAIAALLTAEHFSLFFDETLKFEFVAVKDSKIFPNTGDGKSFDQLALSLALRTYDVGGFVAVNKMLESCPDIEEWGSQGQPRNPLLPPADQ